MKLIFATGNKGKIREAREILKPCGIEVFSESDMGVETDVEETGLTFEENAVLKAEAIFNKTDGVGVIADDSGLCVDALDGKPGIYSARYGGKTDPDGRTALLLGNLSGLKTSERKARFVCAVVCIMPDGKRISVRGTCEGTITEAPQGTNGFGYDPVFIPDGFDQTFGELDGEIKNRISHRAKALRLLKEKLK